VPSLFEPAEIEPFLNSPFHLNFWLLCRMYSTLAYPSTDERAALERRQIHAAFAAVTLSGLRGLSFPNELVGDLDNDSEQVADPDLAATFERLHLGSVGDRHSLLLGRGLRYYLSEVQEKAQAWWRVGKTVCIVRAADEHHSKVLKGGASLNKAIAMVERIHGIDRGDLLSEWSDHKSVAHLCAALFHATVLGKIDTPLGIPEPDTIPWILCAAYDYEHFVTSFAAVRSREPLVKAEAIWKIPIDMLGGWRASIPPLNNDQLAILISSKAPKRID
jgi:hypothetical protein